MPIRFLVGRAGTGKTYHCINAIRTRLAADAIAGARLILLVPEQAGLQMERAIVGAAAGDDDGNIPGAHRADVLSFQRLAFRVMESAGAPVRAALTEPARAMVLRHLVARESGRLQYYRSSDRLAGFCGRLSESIAELIQEAVEPQQLEQACLVGVMDGPIQRAKLLDLHRIYRAYLDYLGAERVDPCQYLQLARQRFPLCDWLVGADLWVDGFASLSGQESLTLAALAGLCRRVEITALMDPVVHAQAARPVGLSAARLFSRTRRTHEDLCRLLLDAGLTVEEPLFFSSKSPPRFAHSPRLRQLERLLFASDAPMGESGGGDARLTDTGGSGAPDSEIELIELPSRRVEVDFAVARICRWVQDVPQPYRYRDVAIIVRDLELYQDLLTAALRARGIPFFVDRRRMTAHHPLVELLRCAVAMAAEDMSLDSVRTALKTGLLDISVEAADELENYILARRIAGLDAWRSDDWIPIEHPPAGKRSALSGTRRLEALSRINESRRSFLTGFEPWLAFATSSRGRSGRDWVVSLMQLFRRLAIRKRLQKWAEQSEKDADLDSAEEHRQVWRDTMSLLDDLAFAFADITLNVRELREILETGLAGFTLGLAPSMIDEVLVGSIDRSRHPSIKAAVILGFNDGVFPKTATEDSILNDDDRSCLTAAGIRVGSAARDRVRDEALLAYIALTRASERVVVTYAASDNEGKSLRPSMYVDRIQAACPGLKTRAMKDPVRSRSLWDILAWSDAPRRLTMEFRSRPPLREDDAALRGRWNAMYDRVKTTIGANAAARRAVSSLGDVPGARLSRVSVEELLSPPFQVSVSQLESYAACPFQHFAKYGLNLCERPEGELAPVDVGRVHHAVLEDFYGGQAARDVDAVRLADEAVPGRLRDSCARVAKGIPPGEVASGRDAYRLSRTALHLLPVIAAQRNVSRSGAAGPCAAEVPFGEERPGALPPLELHMPSGRRAFLRGVIDRVDLAEGYEDLLGVVIDYKLRRDEGLRMDKVFHGLALQLPAYLLALEQGGRALAGSTVRPIAGLYFNLTPRYEKVAHPDEMTGRQARLPRAYRPRGVIVAERLSALETKRDGAGWSPFYSVQTKKDGGLGNPDQNDAVQAASFDAMLMHARLKLGELAEGILDGAVAVRPYRLGTDSPCSWCPMRSACRFETGINNVRFLPKFSKAQVFDRWAAAGP